MNEYYTIHKNPANATITVKFSGRMDLSAADKINADLFTAIATTAATHPVANNPEHPSQPSHSSQTSPPSQPSHTSQASPPSQPSPPSPDTPEQLLSGPRLHFDLAEVDYIASAFIHICVQHAKIAGPGKFSIVNCQPFVKKTLKIAGFDSLFIK